MNLRHVTDSLPTLPLVGGGFREGGAVGGTQRAFHLPPALRPKGVPNGSAVVLTEEQARP